MNNFQKSGVFFNRTNKYFKLCSLQFLQWLVIEFMIQSFLI